MDHEKVEQLARLYAAPMFIFGSTTCLATASIPLLSSNPLLNHFAPWVIGIGAGALSFVELSENYLGSHPSNIISGGEISADSKLRIAESDYGFCHR